MDPSRLQISHRPRATSECRQSCVALTDDEKSRSDFS
jgi:hypothetical protein